jgi:hypothetical protein
MKKLLILLFSIFFLSSPSVFADDISDFEIEGINIGDSLLDYMTEDEILEGIERTKNDYLYLSEPHKYAEVYLYKNLQTYSGLSFFVTNSSTSEYLSNKNEKYKILSIRGLIFYKEDFDSCIQKRDEIVEDLSNAFPDAQKIEDSFSHPGDPSGNSFIDAVYFNFDSGALSEVSCTDLEESFRIKINWSEGLSVTIDSEEIISWLRDY